MAKFYAGQRVRIVSEKFYPQMVGKECTLVHTDTVTYNGRPAKGWVTDLPHPHHGGEYGVMEFEIEPLTPPKQQETITWDEACFDRNGKYRQPEYAGVRA